MLNYDSFEFFANLFVALAVVLPVYRLVRNVLFRRLLLGFVGVYLVYFIAPRLALFYVIGWVVVGLVQWLVAQTAERRFGTPIFAFSVVLILAPMLTWKIWTDRFVIDFNLWSNTAFHALTGPWGDVDLTRDIILPLGLSFSTFRALDLVIKTYLGALPALRPDETFFYAFFPPVQLIGPVIQYTEIMDGVQPRRTTVSADLREGLLLVASGLFKIFIVSFPLQSSSDVFSALDQNSLGVIWLELLLFTLYFFFNFAGYSDLAVGAARMLGFDIGRNFDWPYAKTNPQTFWNSWHISLTGFFRRNVFVPFGGMRQGSQYRALFFTIIAIALWHDLSIPLVVFGLYHAAGLMGHRYLLTKRQPPTNETFFRRLPKMAAMVGFFGLSLPLMVINANQILPVYSHLIGVS